MDDIILASGSNHRATILKNAGLKFQQITSNLDERALEAPLNNSDVTPKERSEILAEAKGRDVSKTHPQALVIGCDQILAIDEKVFHKAQDMEEARHRLLELSGKTHTLYSAISLSKNDQTVWRHVAPCKMTMRTLSPEFIGKYLAQAGADVLSSVGVYQIEGLGAQLFDKIEADQFSIIGLPLLPLLQELRNQGVLDG